MSACCCAAGRPRKPAVEATASRLFAPNCTVTARTLAFVAGLLNESLSRWYCGYGLLRPL